MAKVYYVFSEIMCENESYFAYIDFTLSAMAAAGAVVIEEKTFVGLAHFEKKVMPDDKVVGFFLSDENAHLMYEPVKHENRWVHIIDERATEDGLAYQGRIEYCKRFNVARAVIAYQNKSHMKFLDDAGISHVAMPIGVPNHRERTEKPNIVTVSGAFDPKTYPIRTRLKKILKNKFPDSVKFEPVFGPEYYDILDKYQFGIVCKAGFRDRLVAKYVEFGMCHVLPVGDCPSYMPEEMKNTMVNVEGMTNKEIKDEIKRLLKSPDELRQRQDDYCQAVHDNFDLINNARRVWQTILMT